MKYSKLNITKNMSTKENEAKEASKGQGRGAV
jgi:hypothetical protein